MNLSPARQPRRFTYPAILAGLFFGLLLLLLVRPRPARATASWLWHGGNLVAGGVTTHTVRPGQDVTAWLKVGFDGTIDRAQLYVTTDGTEPQGAYDTATNGQSVAMTLDHTENDPAGLVAWWQGTLPAQPLGTQVRYKIAAWHSGGGELVYAESPTGKTATVSEEATAFAYFVSDFTTPDWVNDALIYQVFIDRFFDGSTANNIDCPTVAGGGCLNDIYAWNGGDLAGVQARLDYLQDLGINTLWLSPVYDNPKTQIGSEFDAKPGVVYDYHGYEALDFFHMDPNFGTTATLHSLVDAAHARGLRVILDFVPNHSSNQHPYFKDAGDNCTASPYFRWYNFGQVDAQGKLQHLDAARCVPGHTTWWGDNDVYADFFGVKEMPQLDNDYGPVRRETIRQALNWIETYRLDGLRLDYAPGPSHSFWMALRAAVKAANPDAFLVGEIWTDGGIAERRAYQGELDSALSFDLYFLFKDFFATRSSTVDTFDGAGDAWGLSDVEQYFAPNYVRTTFLDNHDVDRFLFAAGQNTGRLKLAYLAQMTMAGPPVIYYGSEVGLTQVQANAGIPERSRARMLWGDYLASPPAGWDNPQNGDVREFVKQLIALRTAYSPLRRGERVTLYRNNDDGTFAYRRSDLTGSVLVALNNSDTPHSLSLPNLAATSLALADGTVLEDKLSGRTVTVANGKVALWLEANQGAILVPLASADAVRVDFSVRGFTTQPGQDIYVVGNVPELGGWNPAAAVRLNFVDATTWAGPVNFVSGKGRTIQYKYVVRSSTGVVWESGANRACAVPQSGSAAATDTWSQPGTGCAATAATPLGTTLVDGGVRFALFTANAARVELSIYPSPTASVPSATHLLAKQPGGDTWTVTVPGAAAGTAYGYRVWGPNWDFAPGWVPGTPKAQDPGFHAHVDAAGNRFNPNKLLSDPYAKAVGGEFARVSDGTAEHYASALWGGTDEFAFLDSGPVAPKSIVVDDTFDWSGDVKPATPLDDSIAYEVHLRGFTRANTAISDTLRGTYAGFAAHAGYLKELGVTAVELLPVQEYPQFDDPIPSQGATEDRTNYWGYMTSQFFAPNREYLCANMAQCPYAAGEQVAAFKEMVKALHAQGIEVWLDVVYNHTAEGGADNGKVKYVNLRGFDNQNYYTLADDRSQYWESTGVGNNVNASRPAARRLVLDSLRYWIDAMHVDGFRFDLAYELGREGNDGRVFNPDAALLREIAALGKATGTKMIAEAWDSQTSGVGHFPDGWSEWNGPLRDTTRRFVKSDNGQVPALATAVTASQPGFERPPESVNLITAHDGFTLNDLVSYNSKQNGVGPCNPSAADPGSGSEQNDSWDSGGDDALRRRQIRNFAVQLLTDQGLPMLVAGDEFRRTQFGNNNAYMADNACGWIDWQALAQNRATFDFFRKMIALRKAYPGLTRVAPLMLVDHNGDTLRDLTWYSVTGGRPDWGAESHTLAYRLDGAASETGAAVDLPVLYVAYNAYWQDLTFTLPAAPAGKAWHVLVDTATTAEADGNIYFDPARGGWATQPLPAVADQGHYTLQARSSVILLAR